METKKALQRIGWRFSEAIKRDNKSFKVNSNDLEALKAIDKAISEQQKQQFQQNELFTKLYIYLFQKILENDKATVMDKEPRMKLYNLLKKPIERIITDFKDSLNDSERYEVLEAEGISLNHPATISEENRTKDNQNLFKAVKTPENMEKFLGEVWDYRTVAEILETEVNQAINYHK